MAPVASAVAAQLHAVTSFVVDYVIRLPTAAAATGARLLREAAVASVALIATALDAALGPGKLPVSQSNTQSVSEFGSQSVFGSKHCKQSCRRTGEHPISWNVGKIHVLVLPQSNLDKRMCPRWQLLNDLICC